jgi:hypothetical protein
VAIYREAGVALPAYSDAYVTAEDTLAIQALIQGLSQPWHEVKERDVRPLDCVLVTLAGHERHIGLIVKRRYMLHVGLGGGSRIEQYSAIHLKKRISRFMRHEAMA